MPMSEQTPARRTTPAVSAIIPTRNRPELVRRAVGSALAQSFAELEVIVVVDGEHTATEKALAGIEDPRLRVVVLAESKGASQARNLGVRHARGEWIAFLDDDDLWRPDKLAAQMRVARSSDARYPIVSSRIVARTPKADYVWPRRLPARQEPISEYLLYRRSLFQGEGLMATPTLFTRKELLERVPFRDLKKHQDWDWVLRAADHPGTRVEFCSVPLSICHMDQERAGISNRDDWRASFAWAQSMQAFMTPRAYAGFLFTVVAAQAARTPSLHVYSQILKEAVRHGSPDRVTWALFAGMCMVPVNVRRSLRVLLGKRTQR